MATEKNITMKQFNGADYDTLYPKTIASQVDGIYSKDEILTNTTKTLYGLDSSATPNDVFALIGNGWIPSGKGILVIKAVDSDGNDVSNTTFTINPPINSTSNFFTNTQGKICLIADPGTYTISTNSDIFVSANPTSTSITIEDGIAKISNFTITKITSGEVDITESTNIGIPSWVTNIDLFAVGGGASGSCAIGYREYGYGGDVYGGAGGKTATLLSQNLSGKILNIAIGAGGKAVNKTGATGYSTIGNNGGDTSISIEGTIILNASGGKSFQRNGSGTTISNANGGSGGGGGANSQNVVTGGTDGGNGVINSNDGSTYEEAGKGQGTTTRKFGESSGQIYSDGGGGGGRYSKAAGLGGGNGGGNGKLQFLNITNSITNTYKAEDAKTYGSGGGGVFVWNTNSTTTNYMTNITAISGAGYQGLVSLRW